MVVEGENKMKTIKLTEAQLKMLRLALNEYGVGLYEMCEQGGEDKRQLKTLKALEEKISR